MDRLRRKSWTACGGEPAAPDVVNAPKPRGIDNCRMAHPIGFDASSEPVRANEAPKPRGIDNRRMAHPIGFDASSEPVRANEAPKPRGYRALAAAHCSTVP